ncbi:hypothetical protein ACGF0J_21240 [Nonomuraea sp. NPDC047897]|uniref:hypothetical protein n=1 Tax=Nonomuraea sp. NPDC047897 TaxID=3364346 RepID=UPI003716DEDB
MDRLDERHRAWLRALPGWDGSGSVGAIIRRTWDWQLREENLPIARLVLEIEGLAAGGRLVGHVPRLRADRERVETALDQLTSLVDEWVAASSDRPAG